MARSDWHARSQSHLHVMRSIPNWSLIQKTWPSCLGKAALGRLKSTCPLELRETIHTSFWGLSPAACFELAKATRSDISRIGADLTWLVRRKLQTFMAIAMIGTRPRQKDTCVHSLRCQTGHIVVTFCSWRPYLPSSSAAGYIKSFAHLIVQ